jgi:hypothetical protein
MPSFKWESTISRPAMVTHLLDKENADKDFEELILEKAEGYRSLSPHHSHWPVNRGSTAKSR